MNTATLNQRSSVAAERALNGYRSSASQAAVFEEQTRLIRHLIWAYFVLWLVEGGLRRWFLPGLATPLLIIRDPLVLGIYAIAFQRNLFPANGFFFCGIVLAALTFIQAMMLGHGNALVAVYGLRSDFLHVPLIFIMARVIRPKHLLALAKVGAWVAIPYTALLVAQFYSPQDAWVNRGVGGRMEGAGFSGALGRFRPPGTFSFITGPSQLYPLFAACWFTLVVARKFPTWLMIASGTAILVAVPLSISRTLFLSVAIVAIVGVGALVAGGRFSASLLLRAAVAAVILPLAAFQLPAFRDGLEAFQSRWAATTAGNAGFQEVIVGRVWDGLFGAFDDVGSVGFGTGYSTNVGQKLLTQETGFGASEAEWGRLLYDNGVVLGSSLVLYRTVLASVIVLAAFAAWRRRSPASLIFASAAFLLVLNGQWGQNTSLGSSIICGGLALAAARKPDRDESVPVNGATKRP
jgi:hypothetical protein